MRSEFLTICRVLDNLNKNETEYRESYFESIQWSSSQDLCIPKTVIVCELHDVEIVKDESYSFLIEVERIQNISDQNSRL